MKNKIITKINVKDNLIGVMRINDKDFKLAKFCEFKNDAAK